MNPNFLCLSIYENCAEAIWFHCTSHRFGIGTVCHDLARFSTAVGTDLAHQRRFFGCERI